MSETAHSPTTGDSAASVAAPVLSCRGHAAVQATDHRQIEILLADEWANRPAAIGFGARFEPQALSRLRGRVVVSIECGDQSDSFETTLSADGLTGNAIVFRRDPAIQARSFGFDSSKAAADLSAGLKESLRQPQACAVLRFQPVGEDLQRSAGLFIVGMPIGNQADLSPRALAVLGSVDVIFAEDTRVARDALSWRGIRTPIRSCHAHNEAARSGELVSRLLEGQRIALISDAGMPLVADPGARLVDAAIAAGATVTVVPGPSAIMAAIALSGLPAASFRFVGFPPRAAGERARYVHDVLTSREAVIAFEAATRVAGLVADIAEAEPSRAVAVARDLTKTSEKVYRGEAAGIAAALEVDGARGEYVLVVAGAFDRAAAEEPRAGLVSLVKALLEEDCPTAPLVKALRRAGVLSRADAYALVESMRDNVRRNSEPRRGDRSRRK